MATIKVFSPSGVKTVVMLGNVDNQDYDPVEETAEEVQDTVF